MTRRVGIVANTAFNICNFRLGLMRFLSEQGYEVIAIAPADEHVLRILQAGFRFAEIKHLSRKGTNPVQDMLLLNELRGIYRREKLDAVLQYTIKPNIYGAMAARQAGIRSVCTVTGLGYTFLNRSVAGTVARQLYRVAFHMADRVLFQNSDDRDVFIRQSLVPENKTSIVPGSGIDTDYFSPEHCAPSTPDGVTRFVMIGRFLRDKGIYEYAEAARQVKARHPQTEFHLVGDIDEHNPSSITRAELQQWINSGRLICHGYQSDTRPAICTADCVVLPSYREGMPRVILEGLSMGKPCITTDTAGCKDAIDDSCGLLAQVQDADSLAGQLERFLERSPDERAAMGLAARLRAKNIFDNKIIFKHYADILQKF